MNGSGRAGMGTDADVVLVAPLEMDVVVVVTDARSFGRDEYNAAVAAAPAAALVAAMTARVNLDMAASSALVQRKE